jgi:hypothetical protein
MEGQARSHGHGSLSEAHAAGHGDAAAVVGLESPGRALWTRMPRFQRKYERLRVFESESDSVACQPEWDFDSGSVRLTGESES